MDDHLRNGLYSASEASRAPQMGQGLLDWTLKYATQPFEIIRNDKLQK